MAAKAMEAMNPEFILFDPVPVQLQVEKGYYQEFTPISTIGDKQQIVIVVNGTPKQCWDLKKSYLYVRAKITMPDGSNVGNNTNVTVVNNTLHSMFQQVDLELNDKQMSDNNSLYPYGAYIENELTYERDVQDTWLRAEMFCKDTAGQWAVFSRANDSTNIGAKTRGICYNGSAEVELMGRPHCDLFKQDRVIPPNCKLTMKLIPSRDIFVLMTPTPDGGGQVNYRLKITDVRLNIHMLDISDGMALALKKMMMTDNARWFLNKTALKLVTIPAGQTTMMQDNAFLGRLPKRVTICMVADAAMAGGYQQNPFQFGHFNLNYLVMNVNGDMVPSRPYTPDFARNAYIREYMSLYQGLRILFADKSLNLTYEEFANGYAFFIFDLTPNNHSGAHSPQLSGNIRIEAKFSQALAATINMIIYSEYDAIAELDGKGNVISPY